MIAQTFPMFYKRPVPVHPDLHSEKSVLPELNFGFTAHTNSVPLNVTEFVLASKYYPLVFTEGPEPLPVAVLGLRQHENLFVSDEGKWEAGAYIPAYIRRYPFIFMEDQEHQQYTLCLDEESDVVVPGTERPLFIDGKPTPLTQQALEFCRLFQGEVGLSREFVKAIETTGLLTEHRADITMTSGERLSLSGFRIIDEAKLNSLSGEVFLEWRQRGWLPFIYCHLLSVSNWNGLIDRTAKKMT